MYLDPLINQASSALENYPEALAYLRGRGITEEEAKKFRLGFTSTPRLPVTSDEDYKVIMEETKKLYFVRKKLLIPLENSMGLSNGMITRDIGPDIEHRYHQYLTKEASEIGAFFGLAQALPFILQEGVVFVVEGAIDCITMAKLFPNTVSSLTSFINEGQMWQLRMLADTIVMVFDPDKAGRKGVETVFAKYGNKGLLSREFSHWDPNECFRKLGPSKFADLAKKSLSTVKNFKKCA